MIQLPVKGGEPPAHCLIGSEDIFIFSLPFHKSETRISSFLNASIMVIGTWAKQSALADVNIGHQASDTSRPSRPG